MATDERTRRVFLGGAAAVAAATVIGCGDDTAEAAGGGGSGGEGASSTTGGGSGPSGPTGSTGGVTVSTGSGEGGGGGAGSGGGGGATPACEETQDDIEGPFYTEGAPIVDGALPGALDAPGEHITLWGSVSSATTCERLAGATVDIWQADTDGAYDNAGFTFRGRVVTDAGGNFSVRTIIPGHYLNGDQYRPAHIHVKVSAPDHALLTTQLYFPGDPYNEMDPWFDERLLVDVTQPGEGKTLARFDFVIA